MRTSGARQGFTLIELLVVISIIALLAGLAFPALQGAMDTAKKAQAATMCNQLATAVTMWNTEYGTWPVVGTPAGDYEYSGSTIAPLCKSLNGGRNIRTPSGDPDTTTDPKNTRAIQFMSFNKKDLKDGTENEIQNPYAKNTDRTYHLKVDSNYDNVIDSVPNPAGGANMTISQGVAVWCRGDRANSWNKAITSYK